MSTFVHDIEEWAERQFEGCVLGDKRRPQRLVKIAAAAASNPSASFPTQNKDWGDLKAAYRLFGRPEVTMQSVGACHWNQVRKRPAGQYLLICDTTEVSFGYQTKIKGLSRIANGKRDGFLLHSALMVDTGNHQVVGIAGQSPLYRKGRPAKDNVAKRATREKESRVWADVINQIGKSDDGVQWIYVADRGADAFETYCHLLNNQADWVVRATCSQRYVRVDDQRMSVKESLEEFEEVGSYELSLQSRPNSPARIAKLSVCIGKVSVLRPTYFTAFVKGAGRTEISMNVVYVYESDPPPQSTPISWVLYTSLPVDHFDDAYQIIEHYEQRWLIEEFHKALKTGCRTESRKMRDAARLEPMVSLMSIVAVRLLQLKSAAKAAPDEPASKSVPGIWLKMLKAARPKLSRVHDISIRDFYRELAKLGGFLGRKSDGEPGWITIWRGYDELHKLVQGAQLASRKCG